MSKLCNELLTVKSIFDSNSITFIHLKCDLRVQYFGVTTYDFRLGIDLIELIIYTCHCFTRVNFIWFVLSPHPGVCQTAGPPSETGWFLSCPQGLFSGDTVPLRIYTPRLRASPALTGWRFSLPPTTLMRVTPLKIRRLKMRRYI